MRMMKRMINDGGGDRLPPVIVRMLLHISDWLCVEEALMGQVRCQSSPW